MVKQLFPLIAVVLATAAVGGMYRYSETRQPVEAPPKAKVEGTVYMLEKEFLLNLADGRFAKLQVGLVLDHDDTSSDPTATSEAFDGARPDGYGAMPQEGLVRDVITDVLTSARDTDLITAKGRRRIRAAVLKEIEHRTDVKAERVLLADVVVQ